MSLPHHLWTLVLQYLRFSRANALFNQKSIDLTYNETVSLIHSRAIGHQYFIDVFAPLWQDVSEVFQIPMTNILDYPAERALLIPPVRPTLDNLIDICDQGALASLVLKQPCTLSRYPINTRLIGLSRLTGRARPVEVAIIRCGPGVHHIQLTDIYLTGTGTLQASSVTLTRVIYPVLSISASQIDLDGCIADKRLPLTICTNDWYRPEQITITGCRIARLSLAVEKVMLRVSFTLFHRLTINSTGSHLALSGCRINNLLLRQTGLAINRVIATDLITNCTNLDNNTILEQNGSIHYIVDIVQASGEKVRKTVQIAGWAGRVEMY